MMNKNIKVLIAEDDFLVSKEINRILKGLEYEIVGDASNGEEVVKMACELKPDVVLMDIKMPIMDGLEASRLISKQYPLPIVILTAYETPALVEQASKSGVGAFLSKPPKVTEIDNAITIAIARHNDLMEAHQLNRTLQEAETYLQNIINTSIPICITNSDFQIVKSNDSYNKIFGDHNQKNPLLKCYDSRPGPSCQTDACPMQKILTGETDVVCESVKTNTDGSKQYFIVTARPYLNSKGQMEGIVECFQDITVRKEAEMDRDKHLEDLEQALSEIKTLRGIMPICSFCKNIRNDEGYYEQLEGYFHKHSGVDFSHTICPPCMKKHYPVQYESILKNKTTIKS